MFRRTWMYVTVAIGMLLASPLGAMAQEGAVGAAGSPRTGLIGLGIGLGLGIAAGGCGIGQGRLGASAMESIGRNPNSTSQLFVPMIIGFAFVESLTLYSLVISFLLLGKL
jgi:F-type H+-transporting ATPase subunit c